MLDSPYYYGQGSSPLVGLRIGIPPYAEPVHLDAMKLHLRVDSDDEDELVRAWIAAARGSVAGATAGGVMWETIPVVTQFRAELTDAPCGQYLQLPAMPLVSVVSIAYTDTAGNAQAWASSNYQVDVSNGRIVLAYGCYWPAVRCGYGAMTIAFTAGLAVPFTVSGSTVTFYGRPPVTGERVRLVNSGGELPTDLAVETDYFVVGASGQTCGLSLTSGGSALSFGSAGIGTHFVLLDIGRFHAFTSAMKLLCGHWYQNREAVNIGSIASTVPMAVQSCADAARF